MDEPFLFASSPGPGRSTPTEARSAPRRYSSGVVATQSPGHDARELVDLAVAALSRGDLSAAPSLRRGKLLADGAGEVAVSVLARFALALEEAIRGDLAGANRYMEEAEVRGAQLPTTAPNANAVRCIIEAHRVSGSLARGERAIAVETWAKATRTGRLGIDAGAVDARLRAIAERAVSECDPRSTWLVAPKAMWIEAPDGSRIDLSRVALLRKIWRCLMSAHLADPNAVVSSRELCVAAWPLMDPTSPVVRNRMKVALFKMRDAGLRQAIERTGGGLRLATGHRFSWCQPTSSATRGGAVR